MPSLVIDLRSFVRERIHVDNMDRRTIAASELEVSGINVRNIESLEPIAVESPSSKDGYYYIVVGYNKIGDGSVVGP